MRENTIKEIDVEFGKNLQTHIDGIRANPPNWSKNCPISFSEYLKIQEDLGPILGEVMMMKGAREDLQKSIGVLIARAWAAGQDSVNERKE